MIIEPNTAIELVFDNNYDADGLSYRFTAPKYVVACLSAEDVSNSLNEMKAAIQDGYWLAGYLSYELGYLFEPKLSGLLKEDTPTSTPLIWMAAFDRPNRLTRRASDASHPSPSARLRSPPRPDAAP